MMTQEVNRGLVYLSVGTVHASDGHASETVTQVLLGTPVQILETSGGWRRIRMPDGYTGWINGGVRSVTEAEWERYRSAPKIIVTALYASAYSAADPQSRQVSDLVAGCILRRDAIEGAFYRVSYPDGRCAFVKRSDARPYDAWLSDCNPSGADITATAQSLSGIPYVWGGTSSKGVDCSGLTRLVYFLHGIVLPRDASQQARCGKLTDDTAGFAAAAPGDLLFFGEKASDDHPSERVVHVAIYLGNRRFIHASDYVRIGSFDPKDPLYDAYNRARYLYTKRMIGEAGTPGIETVLHHESYRP